MKQACIYMITNTANGLSTVINKRVRAKQKELSVLRKKEESKQRSIEINRTVASALLDQDIAAFKTKHGITNT